MLKSSFLVLVSGMSLSVAAFAATGVDQNFWIEAPVTLPANTTQAKLEALVSQCDSKWILTNPMAETTLPRGMDSGHVTWSSTISESLSAHLIGSQYFYRSQIGNDPNATYRSILSIDGGVGAYDSGTPGVPVLKYASWKWQLDSHGSPTSSSESATLTLPAGVPALKFVTQAHCQVDSLGNRVDCVDVVTGLSMLVPRVHVSKQFFMNMETGLPSKFEVNIDGYNRCLTDGLGSL